MSVILPLKVRLGLRDHFDIEDSTPKTSLAALNALIAPKAPYRLELDWFQIREKIPESVLDHDVLVPNVVDALTVFIDKLNGLLQADIDGFRSKFIQATARSRTISTQVHPVAGGGVTFTRFTEDGTVILFLPCVRGGYAPNSSFGHDIEESLFNGISQFDPITTLGPGGINGEYAEEPKRGDWLNIGGTRTWGTKLVFPDANQIPRPENILKQTPLYIRLNENATTTKIDNGFIVEGHQATIDLIHDYLVKHARDPGRPLVIFKKKLSWGTSLNSLCVQDLRREFICSPLIVVALLEGTLGYERIGEVRDGQWIFQRATDFSL